MSGWFTLEDKAEEWLDVKPKEEVLEDELKETKNDLDAKATELKTTSLEVDLLKGHKTLLESERESLQVQLKEQQSVLSRTGRDLEVESEKKDFLKSEFSTFKATMERQNKKLEESLSSCKSELETAYGDAQTLHLEIASINQQRDVEQKKAADTIVGLNQLVGSLQDKLLSLAKASQEQTASLAQCSEELQVSRTNEKTLQSGISDLRREAEDRSKELSSSKSQVGLLSALAEKVQQEKETLERSLIVKEEALTTTAKFLKSSLSREDALKKELVDSKSSVEKQGEMLREATNKQAASTELASKLQETIEALKEDQESSNRKQEEVSEALAQEQSVKAALVVEKAKLEQDIKDQEQQFSEQLVKAKTTSPEQDALRRELELQRTEFQKRLKDVNEILGTNVESSINAWAGVFSFLPRLMKSALQF